MWQSEYHDTMIDHDKNVGTVLDALDELGIADDTIVIYSTDNGPHRNTWPDAGTTPFRSEKDTNWEGAFRVPEMIRWPGKIKAGTSPTTSSSTTTGCRHCWPPPAIPMSVEKLKKGYKAGADGNTEYKVHIDGFNLLPYLTGEVEPARGAASSTSPTMATWSGCGSRTGRSCSWSSAARARCGSGPSRSRRCGCRSCSTCAPTRSSTPTSRRTPTTSGSCATTISSSTPPRWRRCSWTRSRSSRPARAGQLQHRSDSQEAQRVPGGRLDAASPGTTDPRSRRSSTSWVASPPKARLRCARRPRRGVRQRRHAVVREADVHPARLPAAPIQGAGRGRPGAARQQPYKAAVHR